MIIPMPESPSNAFPYPFTAFLSPILRVLSDGGEHEVEEIRLRVAADLSITQEHLFLFHEKIHQSVFTNKMALAFNQLVCHEAITAAPSIGKVAPATAADARKPLIPGADANLATHRNSEYHCGHPVCRLMPAITLHYRLLSRRGHG
jgi:hypothetical protein